MSATITDTELVCLIGYYTDPRQTVPEHDPGCVACVICGEAWTDDTVRTICLAALENPVASLFYRGHRKCFDALTEAESIAWDERVLRAFAASDVTRKAGG